MQRKKNNNKIIPLGVISVSLLVLSSQVNALPDVLNFDLTTEVVKPSSNAESVITDPVKLSKIIKRKKPSRDDASSKSKHEDTKKVLVKAKQELKPVKINSKPVKPTKEKKTAQIKKPKITNHQANLNKAEKAKELVQKRKSIVVSKTNKKPTPTVLNNKSTKPAVAKKTVKLSKPINISKTTIDGKSKRVGKTSRKGKSEWISKSTWLNKPAAAKSKGAKPESSAKAVKVTKAKSQSAKPSSAVKKSSKTSLASSKSKSKTSNKSSKANKSVTSKKSSKAAATKSSKSVAKAKITDSTANTNDVSRLNKSYKSVETINASKKTSKPKKKKTYSLGGQITIKDNLEADNPTFSVSASYKPDASDYYYVKGGLKHSFKDGKEDLTYSWGVGYDDWHKGTFTVQVNHWGGIEKGEGLDLDNAFVSIGYKVKSEFLKKHKLSSGITLAKQIGSSGKPTLTTSLSYAPKSYWFVKGILATPLDGGQSTWNYSFGFDDWHPGTFGFEYSNYAGSKLSETNFRKGDLAVFYKWKFK